VVIENKNPFELIKVVAIEFLKRDKKDISFRFINDL